MKYIFVLVFTLLSLDIASQIRNFGNNSNDFGRNLTQQELDSVPGNEIQVKLSGKTKYTDYKIISFKNDTTIVDTLLNIQKERKFNFLRKDNFELLPFHNQGQTFNSLAYSFKGPKRYVDIGFSAKQFNYYNLEDVPYFHVPTPTSEILYKTGMEQGQVLDAFFTTNFSKRFNIYIAYKGLRSLGHYRRSLASSGNFRFSFRYETPKDQYHIRGHYTNQGIFNQESGGLTSSALKAFKNNDENFTGNRERMDVNLTNAESTFDSERFYLEHSFKLFSTKDSLNQKDFSNLKVGHALVSQFKSHNFKQGTASNDFFGDANKTNNILDSVTYNLFDNQLFLDFNSKYILGKFRVKTNYKTYKYGYEYLLNSSKASINKNKLKGQALSFGANWNAKIKNFYLNASAGITPGNGRLAGNHIYGEAFYKKDSVFKLKAHLLVSSQSPNFNFLLHQSSYNKYNWLNSFKNTGTRNLGGTFESKWGNASIDITNIDDYVYLDENSLPQQFPRNINYLKLKASKEFVFGKFALDNTLMYQKVANGQTVFRVPEFVTRNTFYYHDNWFKGDPLLIHIGLTFNYFTKYKANAYNPLLGEFYLQNKTEIGYPTVDFFLNGRIRRTRVYFKLDNLSSFFANRNYFSAPNYPYRDFSIRFGLVWNWFI